MKSPGRTFLIVAATAIVSLGVAAYLTAQGRVPAAMAPLAKVAPKPTATPALDPLQIDAIRSRSYTASQLTVTQNLGDQGGYNENISSFVSDDFTEYALVTTPSGTAPDGGWPVIILAHGYINPAQYVTVQSYAGIMGELSRAGYMVIKPDYRGHGQSQGSAEGGHFSPVYTYDVLNLIATLKHQPGINPARIGLMGHSLGGHVALRTIVASTDIKATVLLSGVVGSINDILYNWPRSPMPNDQPKALVSGTRQKLIDKYGTPQANPTFWNSVSAINYVSAVSGSVQIAHSVGDTTVPVAFSRSLNSALQAQHKQVEYYEYPGDDHQFIQNHALAMQRAIAFYRAHL